MSRFAVVYEDPSYEQEEDIMDYLNNEIDGDLVKPFNQWSGSAQQRLLSDIVDGWVRTTVAEKPQEELSPYATMNS